MSCLVRCRNGQCLPFSEVPEFTISGFRNTVLDRIAAGGDALSLFGVPEGNGVMLVAILGFPQEGQIEIARTRVDDTYPSLTPDAPQFHWFEREIAEQWGIVPANHPWLKPIRFESGRLEGRDAWQRPTPIAPGVTDYFQVDGPEVHEVAVGPVHAGIIEPGHFRFQCHGETVFHLEIELGYQHRGIERALVGGPDKRTRHYMETLAGDTSIGHGIAHAMISEGLGGAAVSPRAQYIRAIALELERLANHTGDLGALAGDIGYLPTLSFCGRLRGDYLNITAMICGNRFGRNLVLPGGVRCDIPEPLAEELKRRLLAAFKDTKGAVDLLWLTPSVLARFEETGKISREDALSLGVVGPVARACGVEKDTRRDFPSDVYAAHPVSIVSAASGDVHARAQVRWMEIEQSKNLILQLLREMPNDAVHLNVDTPSPNHIGVSLVEGWRGRICHVAITDAEGRYRAYKVVDPSFHNWFALSLALRNAQISDFPLCNKSFNLSYCGHDL